MTVEVLLSCMHQNDDSIISRSNLANERVLVINQCCVNEETHQQINDKQRIIHTGTRGLSVSRNLAVANSVGDICLLADDDERFVDSVGERIARAYEEIPDADLIIFEVSGLNSKLKNRKQRLKGLSIYRASSVQISFKRASVFGKVFFDEKIGSGTKYKRSEDNKFVRDCYRNRLKIYHYPLTIANLDMNAESQSFSKYDAEYFELDAAVNRYVMGFPLAALYAIRFLFLRRSLYKDEISLTQAAKAVMRGLRDDRLSKS